jgi:hypothetical protein
VTLADLDRMAFRREFILLEDGTPFGERMEPWQAEDFAALDNGEHLHALLERPRGHSKTGDLGTEATTELILGRPGQMLFCAAADEDQARLLFDDVAGKFKRHPALARLVTITQRDIIVKATGSRLRVLPADAPSAYGLRPDWIAVDELAEWKRRDLWDSLWSATGKRPRCRVLVISTAGWDKTSVAWEVRQNAEREADWYFSSRGQCASWIRPEWLAQQRRTLPTHVFARLHECRWVEGAGAWLSADQVDAIFSDVPEGDGESCLGLDIGIAKDRTAIARVQRAGEWYVVADLRVFAPSRTERVDLGLVETELDTLARRHACPVYFDPHQAESMAQRLTKRGIDMQPVPFTSEKRRALFTRLLDLIRRGMLRARPHDLLRAELLGLEVKETLAGWRVDHKASGHDDAVIAVGLALLGLPEEADMELRFLEPRPLSALEVEQEAAREFEERRRLAEQTVLDEIARSGVFGFRT